MVAERGKVSKPSSGPTVLIVDDDLGFACWLGEMFHEAGYRSAPALSARQAVSFVKELNLKVAAVVVNPSLPGVRKLIKTLSQTHCRLVKVILIRDPAAPATLAIRAHARLERPSGWEPASRHEWHRKLKRILEEAEEAAASARISGYPSH
jgi:DNA-binding NtrC family response regulator